MLSLVMILCAIVWVVLMLKMHKGKAFKAMIIITVLFFVIASFMVTIWCAMCTAVNKIDTSYYQQQVATLKESNKQIESWITIIEGKLSDNPELLSHVEEYLNEEINSNNEEISNHIDIQRRNTIYRWWLWFE